MRVNSSRTDGTPRDYYRPVRFTLVQEILLRVVTLIPLTIILTSFYNRSSRSIQATAIFHASMNTSHSCSPITRPRGERFFLRRVRGDRGPNVVPHAECRTAQHCGWLVASIESQ
jgi:hypothetical protein